MLPEKKKRLIIAGIALVLIIITVFLLGKLSSYIKSKNDNNVTKERRNDDYPDKYDYYGILKDEDGIYKIYGIGETEEYLNVRTFYNIQDYITKDNKLLLFSDATNELRYDSKKDEFYFYELDSSYSNKEIYSLSDNYIIINALNKVSYKKFNEEETILITDELKNENVLVRDNKVYYLKKDGIYEYNLDTKENKCIINDEGDISIINVLGDYIYINKDGEELIYKISSALKIVLSNYIKEEYSIVNLTDAGIVIKQDGQLKIFSFITNKILNDTFDLEGYNNTYSLYLGNDLYYMNLELNNNKKHIIIDMSSKKIIKEFKENYLYIWRNVWKLI